MKKILGCLLASFVVLMFGLPAYAGVEVTGNICAGMSSVEDAVTTTEENLQFDNNWLNLNATAKVADGVTAVGQIRCKMTGDATSNTAWARSVQVEMSKLIPNASLMVGRIELPIGKEGASMTKGAAMMKNAMIGDSALADNGITGAPLDYGMAVKTTLSTVNCLAAITNGNSGTIQDNNGDKNILLNLGSDIKAVPGLSLAASYMTNDAAGNNATDETTKMVIDAAYAMKALTVGITYGNGETDTGNTGTKTENSGLGCEVSYTVNDACSVAVRYGKVDISTNEIDTAEVTKIQLGCNYKLADNTLLKLEYVKNDRKEAGTDLDTAADYDGLKAAVAVKF